MDLKEETVLYVTHKYLDETLKKFDCILVFKQGRIVEQGSFEELMKNKGDFFSLKKQRMYLVDYPYKKRYRFK